MDYCFNDDWNYFMIPLLVAKRELLINKLKTRNIEIGAHFSQSLKWASHYGYLKGECPNAENVSTKIITIPCHYNMSRKHLNRLLISIRNENFD